MPYRLTPRERLTLIEHDPVAGRQVRARELIRLHRLAAAGLLSFMPRDVRRPRRSHLTKRGQQFAQIVCEQTNCKTLGSVENAKPASC